MAKGVRRGGINKSEVKRVIPITRCQVQAAEETQTEEVLSRSGCKNRTGGVGERERETGQIPPPPPPH